MAFPLPTATEHRSGGSEAPREAAGKGQAWSGLEGGRLADGQSRLAPEVGTGKKMSDPVPRAVVAFLQLGSCLGDKLDGAAVRGGNQRRIATLPLAPLSPTSIPSIAFLIL